MNLPPPLCAAGFGWVRLLGVGLAAGACAGEEAHTGATPAWSGTWEIGPAESCAAPIEPHWTDRSDLVWDGSYYPELQLGDSACVAFEKVGDDWSVWASGHSPLDEEGAESEPVDLLRVNLTTGERSVVSVPHLYQRFVVDDFDLDGADDLGTFLSGGTMLWGGTSEPVALPDPQVSFAYAALDLDGDAHPDLVALGGGDPTVDPPAPQVMRYAGDRAFSDPVSAATGGVGQGFASQVLDWDADGDPDIYQCNDAGQVYGPNVVLLNEGGELVVGDARGADLVAGCMSASFGDVNGDGTLDIYIAQAGPQRLLLDMGSLGFVDAAAALVRVEYPLEQMGWSSVTVDATNDGRPDIVVTEADFGREVNGVWPVWLLEQQADGSFEDNGAARGLPQDTSGRGLALRDVNGDGVVDALIGDVRRGPYLMLSSGCTAGAWVEVEAPSGSVVVVEADGQRWTSLVSRQDGWCGWGPPIAHIGLGGVTHIDRITVTAPWAGSGQVEDVAVRSRLRWIPD